MRFGLISCIHANLPALEAVLRDAQQMRCDTTLCLGDIVHASLATPERWGYIFDRIAAAEHFAHQTKLLCFNGHTHVPVAFHSKKGIVRGGTYTQLSLEPGIKYLVNVGSVGQPRDGRAAAAYVVYDASSRTVELRRVDYPQPPSGGHGVGKPLGGGSGPPKVLPTHSDDSDEEDHDAT